MQKGRETRILAQDSVLEIPNQFLLTIRSKQSNFRWFVSTCFIFNVNGGCLPKLCEKCRKKLSANEALLETLMDAESAESCSDLELDLDNSNTDPNYLSSGDRKSRSCHRKKKRIDVYSSNSEKVRG